MAEMNKKITFSLKYIIKELQINRLFCTFASKILVEH